MYNCTTLISLISVIFLFSFITPSFSQENLPPEALKVLKERLKLTPDQEKQMRSITMKYAKERIQMRADLQVKHIEAKEIGIADNPDRSLLEKKLREIGEIQLRQKLMAFDQLMERKKVLTPDQQKSAKEFFENAPQQQKQGMRGMRGKGFGWR